MGYLHPDKVTAVQQVLAKRSRKPPRRRPKPDETLGLVHRMAQRLHAQQQTRSRRYL